MQLSKFLGGRATMVGAAGAQRRSDLGAPRSKVEQKLELLSQLVERCLDIEPVDRITAADAAAHEIFRSITPTPPAEQEEAPLAASVASSMLGVASDKQQLF